MIFHTENDTTTKVGQSIATVIADSEYVAGERITTIELVYPRYIHSELMTHRVFSRNASSSRATPIDVTAKEVMFDPVFFDKVCANQKGMTGGEELPPEELERFKKDWNDLAFRVGAEIMNMYHRYGIHKQTLNRALEPWSRIRTLVTATDWDNFFNLRLAPDAQPEIQSLAKAMKAAMDKSKPRTWACHMPYVTDEEFSRFNPDWWKISAARCARVSYARLDGKPTDMKADIELADRLLESKHLSPFEHAAFAMHGRHANFTGWQSARNSLGF